MDSSGRPAWEISLLRWGRRRKGSRCPPGRRRLVAGEADSHGFALAKAIADAGDSRELTATGTMYRALHRLDAAGLVESWWEDPNDAAEAGRPRRRSYRITGAGATALAKSRTETTDTGAVTGISPGFAT